MLEPRAAAGRRIGARMLRRVQPQGHDRLVRRVAAIALCASVCFRAGKAGADSPEALFEQGIAELRAGHFELACPALEQSQALEANPGTLLALADCLERWQKLASASARYTELIDALARASESETTYRADQLAFARAALTRLEPQIPRLRLSSQAPLPSETRVLLDGRELTLDGAEHEISLDPGHHVLETQAVGHRAWKVEIDLVPGEHALLLLRLGPPLPAPASPPSMTREAPSVSPPASARPFEGERASPSVAWRSVGWGLGGLGVAGLGVGAVAGTLLLQTCPALDCADHPERGKRLALITDIGLGVGVAALVSSVIVLVKTEPAVASRDDSARWQPVGVLHAHGGWLGMSHPF